MRTPLLALVVLLAFAGAGLLLAAAACGDRFRDKLGSGGWRAPSGIAVLALAAVACTAPALAAAAWVTSGVRGPVAPSAGPVLPEFVSVSSTTGLRLRTLVLRVDPRGRVAYSVLRDSDPLIGASELAVPPAGQRALDLSVAALTAPAGGAVQDQGRSLSEFGIGYVLLPAPIDPALARLLDGVPGLRPVSHTGAFALWRVSGPTARVRVVEQSGTVVPVNSGPVSVAGASVPGAGGTLVLAEPVGRWSAALNGSPLAPLAAPVGGWAQGFRLPPGGGSLTVSHSQLGRTAVVALEALAVAIVLALGLPGTRVAGETEEGAAAAARHSSRARDQADDRGRERKPPRRGRGRPAIPARPRVRRPPVPAARGGQRAPGAVPVPAEEAPAGGRGTAPAGVRGTAPAGVRGAAGARGGPSWPDEPAAMGSFPGDLAADSPAMASHARGGTGPPGPGAGRPPAGGRGMPGDPAGLPPRSGPGTDPGGPRQPGRRPPDHARPPGYRPGPGRRASGPGPEPVEGRSRPGSGPAGGRGPGYDPAAGRGGRPGYDTGPGQAVRPGPEPGAGRGRPGYETGPGRARPGYDSGPGRARPGYDSDPGRGGRRSRGPEPERARAGYEAVPGRDGRPGYDPGPSGGGRPGYDTAPGGDGRPGYDTGPGRRARPEPDPGAGRGRPGYDSAAGLGPRGREPGPDPARPGYDPVPGRDGRPGYDPGPGGGRPGYDAAPGAVRPGYETAPGGAARPGYDTPPGGAARPWYEAAPRRGRQAREPEPGRGQAGYGPAPGGDYGHPYGPPPDAPAERGARRSRLGPAGGERPGAGAQRGAPPGDAEALSPLPPLPPRRPSGMDGYATDAGGPDWDAEPQHEPGETDW